MPTRITSPAASATVRPPADEDEYDQSSPRPAPAYAQPTYGQPTPYGQPPANAALTPPPPIAMAAPGIDSGELTYTVRQGEFPSSIAAMFRVDPVDYVRQAEAIIALDVSASFGGSLERAASGVRASMLVASSLTDEVVNPEPARQFARLARGQVLELDGACGHRAPTWVQHLRPDRYV